MGALVFFVLSAIINNCLAQSLDSQVTIVQEVSLDPNTQKSLQFVCPNLRAARSIVRFYKVGDNGEEITVHTSTEKPIYEVNIEPGSSNPLATYLCQIQELDGQLGTVAKLVIYDKSVKQVPSTLRYDSITFEEKELGESVDVVCPLVANAKWRKPARFQMSGNIVNGRLNINKISNSDYGAYYCHGDLPPNADNIFAAKIILKPKNIPKENSTSHDASFYYTEPAVVDQPLRVACPIVSDARDQVAWEKPAQMIHLIQSRDLILDKVAPNDMNQFFYCRVTNPNDPAINKVAKLVFNDQRSKNGIEMSPGGSSVGGSVNTDTRQLVLSCISDISLKIDPSQITWYRDNKQIGTGNQLLLNQLSIKNFGNYSCRYISPEDGGHPVTRYLSLKPTLTKSDKVEMTDPPGKFFYYHHGDKRELHCEIHHLKVETKDIIWTFKNKKIDFATGRRMFRLLSDGQSDINMRRRDTLATSILLIKNMSVKDQGEYSCFTGEKMFTTHLFLFEETADLEISPDHDQVKRKGESAEIHCQINSEHYTYRDIKWRFYPDGDDSRPVDLPDGARIDEEEDFDESSYVTIDDVQLEHSGRYECRVKSQIVSTRIIVADPQITVSPKNQTIRLGETARLLCVKKELPGKMTWRREDKRSLSHHESIIDTGNNRTILIIKSVTWDYHNLTYRCQVGQHHDTGTIFVKGDCEYGKRQCADKTCIDEGKFCDGIEDCGDGSDESDDNCADHCEPNQVMCKKVNNKDPSIHCITKHWECDGENDCGNNYDEMNCPQKNEDKCLGTHYLCNDNSTLIPRAYWCDKEVDCESKDDEQDCSPPQLVYPTGGTSTELSVKSSGDIQLKCVFVGRPLPTVIWRYNWGFLPKSGDINTDVNNTYSNCNMVTSILTISRISSTANGVYTCEAMAKSRVMGPDYTVNVINSVQKCTGKMFNDGAYDDSECLRCYCSRLNVECNSIKGYALSGEPKESSVDPADYTVVPFDENLATITPDSRVTFEDTKKQFVFNDELNAETASPKMFYRGKFGLDGSWLMSYGFYIRYTVTSQGFSGMDYKGAYFVLYGPTSNLYWCRPKDKLLIYPTNITRNTLIEIKLFEGEPQWYSDVECSKRVNRDEMMKTLTNVVGLGIRIKYFERQEYLGISQVKVNFVAPYPSNPTHTVPLIEQCQCPVGYSGTSCEEKNP